MRDYEYPSNLEIMEKWEYMSERESKINIEHIYVQRSKSERERGERELKRNKKEQEYVEQKITETERYVGLGLRDRETDRN